MRTDGMTLLEVLLATAIFAAVAVPLAAAIHDDLGNLGRANDADNMSLAALRLAGETALEGLPTEEDETAWQPLEPQEIGGLAGAVPEAAPPLFWRRIVTSFRLPDPEDAEAEETFLELRIEIAVGDPSEDEPGRAPPVVLALQYPKGS